MTRPLRLPPPLVLTLDWRLQGRRRRRIQGTHPNQTALGDCRMALAANAGRCWPTRTRNAPVVRPDAIAPNSGSAGALMFCLHAQRCKIIIWTGGGSESGAARRSGSSCAANRAAVVGGNVNITTTCRYYHNNKYNGV